MIVIILVIAAIIALFVLWLLIRDIGRELSGMDEASKTIEERKNEKIRKEIERWRGGK